MIKMIKLMFIITLSFFLVSCSAKFACKDRVNIEGERCDTITDVYEKKMIGDTLPRKKVKEDKREKNGEVPSPSLPEEVEAVRSLHYEEGKPIRLAPRVIRIWIAPWEDSDGDLHQPSYIYSEISPKRGRWLFGEKEAVTSQPVLRPVERSQDMEGEKRDDVKGIPKENKRDRQSGIEKGRETIYPSIQTPVPKIEHERR